MQRQNETRVVQPAPDDGKRILMGGVLLAGAAACLTVMATHLAVPFSGLGAILVTFGGLTWLSVALLRRRFAWLDRRRGAR